MRLSPEQIKSGILHPDRHVRDAAVSYFSQSMSTDPTIMPLAIEAFERYGRRGAFEDPWVLDGLVQTPDSMRWILNELHSFRTRDDLSDVLNPREALEWLVLADMSLLQQFELEIMALPELDSDVRKAIQERLRQAALDPKECWRELNEFCDALAGEDDYPDEEELTRAYWLVEAIARQGRRCGDRVVATLSSDADDPVTYWKQLLAVRLAGEIRLEAAIPWLLVGIESDYETDVSEVCDRALRQIGSDALVSAFASIFPEIDDGTMILAAEVLGKVHSPQVVPVCLELLALDQTQALYVQNALALALVQQFTDEAIEPARGIILAEEEPSIEGIELRRELLTMCQLAELRFPEFDAWLADAENDEARIQEILNDDFDDFANEQDSDDFYEDDDWDDEEDDEFEDENWDEVERDKIGPDSRHPSERPEDYLPAVEPIRYEQPRVGRNDPCPCGSGKKFKKCCLNKPAPAAPDLLDMGVRVGQPTRLPELPPNPKSKVFRLKVSMDRIEPAIWRRIEVQDCTLVELHFLLQDVMGWQNEHLYMFEAGQTIYTEPDQYALPNTQRVDRTLLSDLVAAGHQLFRYQYDFGDSWWHTIEVEEAMPQSNAGEYPRYLGGERACPPEDSGGAWRYSDLLEMLKQPAEDEDNDDENLQWMRKNFDPDFVDVEQIESRMANWRK